MPLDTGGFQSVQLSWEFHSSGSPSLNASRLELIKTGTCSIFGRWKQSSGHNHLKLFSQADSETEECLARTSLSSTSPAPHLAFLPDYWDCGLAMALICNPNTWLWSHRGCSLFRGNSFSQTSTQIPPSYSYFGGWTYLAFSS